MKFIIYKATNIINGKSYIGQTQNSFQVRKSQHKSRASIQCNEISPFHDAIRKYSFESFTWSVIDSSNSAKELDEKEIFWIEYYQTCDNKKGYNIRLGGSNGGKWTEERRNKWAIDKGQVRFMVLDLQGNEVEEMQNISLAAEKYRVERANITKSIKGEVMQTGGHMFISLETLSKEEVARRIAYSTPQNRSEFGMYDLKTNELITTFKLKTKAASHIGGNATYVGQVLNGKKPQYKGYIFRYLKEGSNI